MGYNTDFCGAWTVTPPLSAADVADLTKFADHDHRDESGVPGSYCQWVPTADGTLIAYDGNEKFYDYVKWIKWLIDNKLGPKGYRLDGSVEWDGDDMDDRGRISIVRNVVTILKQRVVWVVEES